MLRQKMLHRSFKPAKCKTALKLATSRIKLMKNKKEVQLKQLRRDLAQLLETGQHQTARIRVEHVIREEKMIAAYDLIEIYCELISIRLPVIESQKNCPVDLKEAITSVIFASPRCADVPELLDIRKHLTAKYGKEFTTAAIELRPECGVSRMLVEKLSAMAPDVKAKIKVLSSVAEEYNIKWDPESFGEKELKAPEDLLTGLTTLEKVNMTQTEPLHFHAPNVHTSVDHNMAYSDSGGTRTSITNPDATPSAKQANSGQSFPVDRNVFSMGSKGWNMEFKDATEAAQAAAESAERASIAARAAAELSRQPLESQQANVRGFTNEDASFKNSAEQFHKDFASNPFPDKNIKLKDELLQKKENDSLEITGERFYQEVHDGTQMRGHSAPHCSSQVLIDDDASIDNMQTEDRYTVNHSLEEEATKKEEKASLWDEMNESTESKVEFGLQDNYVPRDLDDCGERSKNQLNIPLQAYSNTYNDDHKVLQFNHFGVEDDANKKPFTEQATSDPMHTISHDNTAVIFDESGSEEDVYQFDTGPKYDEHADIYTMSEGRKSPVHICTDTSAWNTRTCKSESELINSADYSEQVSFVPATFDDSDGAKSDNDGDEVDNPELNGEKISRTQKAVASADDSYSTDVRLMNNEKPTINEESSDTLIYNESLNLSSPGSEKGLNYGTLIGGLRNKGYICPPYVKSSSGDLSSSKKESEWRFTEAEQSRCAAPTSQSSVKSGEDSNIGNMFSSRMRHMDSDSDTSQSQKEFNLLSSTREQEPKANEADEEVKTMTNLRGTDAFLDSVSEDSEEDRPKQTFLHRKQFGYATSRRTKPSSPSSYSKVGVAPEASVISSTSEEKKPTNSYSAGPVLKTHSQNVTSGLRGNSSQALSTKEAKASNATPDKSLPEREKSSEDIKQPPSQWPKASASKPKPENRMPEREKSSKLLDEIEQPQSPWRNTSPSSSNAGEKASSSGENPVKKASHVHPKLPDYDSLAARLQALRSSR